MSSFQILAPEFLPPVSYFLPFLKSKTILIADHIQYIKRSNLSGSGILKNGLKLIIPVKNTGFKKLIFKKEIAYIENWNRKHLTSLHHLYHNLPYFDDYFFKLEGIYKKHHTYLNNFLFDQLILFLSGLKIGCDLRLSSNEGFSGVLEENLIRFSKDNSLKIFVFKAQDIESGYIDLEKLHQEQIETDALPNYDNSSLKYINILEFLFQNGPEAAFKIRDI